MLMQSVVVWIILKNRKWLSSSTLPQNCDFKIDFLSVFCFYLDKLFLVVWFRDPKDLAWPYGLNTSLQVPLSCVRFSISVQLVVIRNFKIRYWVHTVEQLFIINIFQVVYFFVYIACSFFPLLDGGDERRPRKLAMSPSQAKRRIDQEKSIDNTSKTSLNHFTIFSLANRKSFKSHSWRFKPLLNSRSTTLQLVRRFFELCSAVVFFSSFFLGHWP